MHPSTVLFLVSRLLSPRRDHYFLSLLPFRYYGLVSRTFHHVCVSAVLTEQCISRLWYRTNRSSALATISKINGIRNKSTSFSMLLTMIIYILHYLNNMFHHLSEIYV